jgi:hypothetical protein
MSSTGASKDAREFLEKFEPFFIPQSIREPDENSIQRHILDCLGALINLKKKKSTIYNLESRVFFAAITMMASLAARGDQVVQDEQEEDNALIMRNFPPPDYIPARKVMKNGCIPLPSASQQKASYWLCMHWAVCIGNTLRPGDICKLIEADPMSVQSIDGPAFKATPAHYAAAATTADGEIFALLSLMAEACPRIAFVKDRNGWLALHYAAAYSNRVEMLEILLQLNPSASSAATSDGDPSLPIHILAERTDMRYGRKVAMMKCLLEADPNSASAVNGNGDTVLHILCDHPCSNSDDLVRLCLKVAPQLASMRGQGGRLPLHVVSDCENYEIIQPLLRTCYLNHTRRE